MAALWRLLLVAVLRELVSAIALADFRASSWCCSRVILLSMIWKLWNGSSVRILLPWAARSGAAVRAIDKAAATSAAIGSLIDVFTLGHAVSVAVVEEKIGKGIGHRDTWYWKYHCAARCVARGCCNDPSVDGTAEPMRQSALRSASLALSSRLDCLHY